MNTNLVHSESQCIGRRRPPSVAIHFTLHFQLAMDYLGLSEKEVAGLKEDDWTDEQIQKRNCRVKYTVTFLMPSQVLSLDRSRSNHWQFYGGSCGLRYKQVPLALA